MYWTCVASNLQEGEAQKNFVQRLHHITFCKALWQHSFVTVKHCYL